MFIKLINTLLLNDPDCQHKIPIADEGSLISAFDDGILMCKMILKVNPDCIDERTIIKEAGKDMTENIEMGIQACKSINLSMRGISTRDFTEKNPVIVLCFIW